MKMTFKIAALALLMVGVAACEKHDFFDEDSITGAVGPENYWTIESAAVKAGESMNFIGQYYSTVAKIDHSEVWYDLHMTEDKLVSCPLIRSFTYSVTSSTVTQQRVLQTIQSYPHSDNLWVDSVRAFVLEESFPVSGTLAPVTWKNPQDTLGFAKNLKAYFGESFANDFKAGITPKLNTEPLNYAAYMDVLKGLSLLDTATLNWMTDSTFDKNSATWKKHFKEYEYTWDIEKIIERIDSTWKKQGRDGGYWVYDTVFRFDSTLVDKIPVYDSIAQRVQQLWEDSVDFYDLILGPEGYSIEYNKSFFINAELRVYDEKGTYSRTDSKKVSIL